MTVKSRRATRRARITCQLGAAALMAAMPMTAANAATPADTLVVAMNIDVMNTLDPAQINNSLTADILQSVCKNLVEYDRDSRQKVMPSLAESWELSDDRLQITFHFRKDANFISGNPVTAHDSVYSLQRTIGLNFGNSSKLRDLGFNEENMKERIFATDDYTMVLKLDKPYPLDYVLQYLGANRASAVIDSKVAMENEVDGDWGNGYLARNVNCVGPYQLAQWNPGESVLLVENENFYGDQPHLPKVLIRHVAESATQRLLIEKGDVDVAHNLSASDMKELVANPDIRVETTLSGRSLHWQFDLSEPQFKDARVRQAMRYLIDYKGLGDTVMAGLAIPRASLLPLGVLGAYEGEKALPYSLDLDKARALLKEAGFEDGFETDMMIATQPYAEDIALHIQENAAQVGVKVNIIKGTQSNQSASLYGRNFETALQSWMWAIWDPHGNASRLMQNVDNSDEARLLGYPAWISQYQNEYVNELVNEAFFAPTSEDRVAKYAELQDIYYDEGATAVLFQLNLMVALRKEVKDFVWHSLEIYYPEIRKEQG